MKSIIITALLSASIIGLSSCSKKQNGSDVARPNTTTSKPEKEMDPEIEYDGHKIRVMNGPYTNNGEPTAEAKQFAEELVSRLPEMKTFASSELLDTYNDSWADDDHPELKPSQFASNLKSPEIVVYDEIGGATIYFSDSDMFGGHRVAVSVYEGKIYHASLK